MSETHTDFYRRWNALARPYFQWQIEQFAGFIGLRVADLGCGPANATDLFLDRDLYLGVDVDAAMTALVAERFAHDPRVRTWTGDFTTPEFQKLARGLAIDTVISLNTIEHIEDDRGAVRAMVELLPAGGTLNLLVPAHQVLFGSLDRLDGHFRRYSKRSLANLLLGLQVRIEKLHYFNAAAVPGWFLKGRVLKETAHADENYRLMNAVLPIVRRVERWVKPPFGLSVIAVARRM